MELKADLHLHTQEGDRFIPYQSRSLIDRAAREGFEVLSITNHNVITFSEDLEAYAGERGILLIPGVEATIEGRHVLLYNLDVSPKQIQTFEDLRRLRGPEWLIVAAHPFFPASICLREHLLAEMDLFDAIEFSHFYTRWINFNGPAIRFAREVGLPLLGTSDSHLVRQLGTTYSLIEADRTVTSVLGAIRKGLVRVATRPLRPWQCAGIAMEMVVRDYTERTRKRFRHHVGLVLNNPGQQTDVDPKMRWTVGKRTACTEKPSGSKLGY